ncbi:MAG TPA: glycosyltransferase [Candidatus Paceibacterota bacterium]
MNKTIFLIFHGRFPSDKAASLFTAKNAEAFTAQGIKVTLIVPKRKGLIQSDYKAYYDIKQPFSVVYIPIIDLFGIKGLEPIAFWLSYISFSIKLRRYLKRTSMYGDIIYSNEILPLFLVSSVRPNCFYEMHDFPESKIYLFGYFLKKIKWVLVHNKWKLKELKKLFSNISTDKFFYEPNAVDLKDFDISFSKEEAKSKLGLPLLKKVAIYTGHLYKWKGVYTLAESAKSLPNDFMLVFIGGTKEDVEIFRNKYADKNGNTTIVSVIGHVEHSQIPLWQKAADVLILPNTAKEKISAFYTSPMKLFEYMASKRPIVATDIPSIREILDETNAIIVKPDNSQALAEGIKFAVSGNERVKMMTEEAWKDVLNHTWDKRAERIIDFIINSK